MHATNLASIGIRCLGELQLDDLCRLQEELDALWKSGKSTISNTLYDKVADGVSYEMLQLTSDPYNFAVKKTDGELKKIVDYLTQRHSQGRPCVDNSIWDILDQELSIRNTLTPDPTITFPSHWTAVSMNESPVQLISLSRSTQEFQEIANFFVKSLQRQSTVIYSITRIQNVRLWHIHQQLRKTISSVSTRLIHGTASPAQQKWITYHGFFRSYCPGGLIGDGVYFAVHANYSNNDPYVMKKTSHRRELFICQVLLGKSSQGGKGLRSPADGCHSVFNRNGDRNDMFCIFNHYQAYPEYIVQYDYE